jgi:dCTP deaminase
MILCDREIKELAGFPYMAEFTQSHPSGMTRRFSEPTFLTIDRILDFEKSSFSPFTAKLIEGTHREMTAEEKEKWAVDNPRMITPFVGEQVRSIVRDADESEKMDYGWLVASGDDKHVKHGFFQDANTGKLLHEQKIISYGISSYGYDIRLADEFKVFTNINTRIINPKDFDEQAYVDFKGDVCVIPPNSFVLARSLEYFKMPNDITGIVFNKSTYARCGINCFPTVIEAGWEGELVLEYANTSSLPAMLFANEGAAQIVFLKGAYECEISYAVGNRKYQKQRGITLPRM